LKLPTHMKDGESIASFLSRVPKQKDPEKQALLEKYLEELKSTPPKICYYCTKENFQSKTQYERHVLLNHHQKLCYPDAPYIKAMNLKPQGCLWEE
jgi:hypothetical protein